MTPSQQAKNVDIKKPIFKKGQKVIFDSYGHDCKCTDKCLRADND